MMISRTINFAVTSLMLLLGLTVSYTFLDTTAAMARIAPRLRSRDSDRPVPYRIHFEVHGTLSINCDEHSFCVAVVLFMVHKTVVMQLNESDHDVAWL